MTDNELLGQQWHQAASALEIECIAPFVLESGGKRFEFACLIPAFGSSKGTLITAKQDREAFNEAKAHGYTCSSMLPETRLPFSPESYKECLVDWGWCKDNVNPPSWYAQHGV